MSQSVGSGDVRLKADDGFELDAFCARPEGQSLGGLVILQEIFGLTDQLKSVAKLYAAHGFASIVPALFDRAAPGTVLPFSEGGKGRDIAFALDQDKLALDVAAAMKTVESGNGVSLLGFCWGGGQALRLASVLDPQSAVSFYGTRLKNHLGARPDCPLLFHFGQTDGHSPPDVIAAVREALPAAETHVYEAGHAFANDARPDMHVPDAARLAHERTFDFLRRAHDSSARGAA